MKRHEVMASILEAVATLQEAYGDSDVEMRDDNLVDHQLLEADLTLWNVVELLDEEDS